jgi:hypothetical protein
MRTSLSTKGDKEKVPVLRSHHHYTFTYASGDVPGGGSPEDLHADAGLPAAQSLQPGFVLVR